MTQRDGERVAKVRQLVVCDRCGLRAVIGAAVEQPIFHLFEDGTLCDDCVRDDRGEQ